MVPSVEDAPVTNRFVLHTRFICTVSVIYSKHTRKCLCQSILVTAGSACVCGTL